MPLISIILFFVLCALLFLLANGLKRRKKVLSARAYGQDNFDINLPSAAQVRSVQVANMLPNLLSQSDAESFFTLVTPYIGSLPVVKREYLYQSINDLKNDLKVNKDIYQYFSDEYKIYEGLNDAQAAEKWSGKS